MKIYNEIVFDVDGNVIYEDSYEYSGDVMLLQGFDIDLGYETLLSNYTAGNLFNWEVNPWLDSGNTDSSVNNGTSIFDMDFSNLDLGIDLGLFPNIASGMDFSGIDYEALANIGTNGGNGNGNGGNGNGNGNGNGIPQVSGMQNMQASQMSSGAVGSRQELGRMLESYKGRTSLIQAPQRQKAIYTIDRFDGGLNLNKSPRDLAYWEACLMDELSPAKVGRLIRLGDFTSTATYAMGLGGVEQENYGLHYFKWSDSINTDGSFDASTPANYLAYTSGDGGVDLWNFSDGGGAAKLEAVVADSKFDNSYKPVYHSASNRLYISDAVLSQTSNKDKTMVCGIVDRRKLFPIVDSANYCITGDSHLFKSQNLYHAVPVKGTDDSEINIVGTQANADDATGGQYLNGVTNANGQHGGIYININFETIAGDEGTTTGWGSVNNNASTTTPGTGSKYYYFYASWLYDDGSESGLSVTPVSDETAGAGGNDATGHTIVATTGTGGEYQKLVVKQVYIDGAGIVASNPRIHGARFYYSEADGNDGSLIGDDKYLWAELDFRYGFKLVSEFGHWNQFEDDSGATQAIQVKNAAESSGSAGEADGSLEITSPPTAFTYYSLNLFHQEEIKDDLMWKTSTVGNGIAFVGNVKYDGREYPDTMLYSGAGETDAGSAYPMWGTFPVDSNRIDIPGAAGEITALKWTSNRVLQFRKNAVYVINVEDVLAPRVEGVYQGMGVVGQYAVTETPFGCAWINENGAYAYNAEANKVRSLTVGRLDTEDFIADSYSKIGYDDRAKMLIIGNYNKRANASNYAYAYSFVTDAWCTWSINRGSYTPISNFAIDHDGYLTGGTRSSGNLIVNKWSASAQDEKGIDYVTKDIDFGKPSLDKRLYTLYISYTGGGSQANMYVYFRVNGLKGSEITKGWTQIQTIQDYTDPYGSTNSTAWAGSSGSPTTGDTTISTADDLDSVDEVESTGKYEQKLAKINLRNLVASSGSVDDTIVDFTSDADRTALPADYLKFARSIQFRIKGTAASTFEINDISLVYKEKRLK